MRVPVGTWNPYCNWSIVSASWTMSSTTFHRTRSPTCQAKRIRSTIPLAAPIRCTPTAQTKSACASMQTSTTTATPRELKTSCACALRRVRARPCRRSLRPHRLRRRRRFQAHRHHRPAFTSCRPYRASAPIRVSPQFRRRTSAAASLSMPKVTSERPDTARGRRT